MRLSHITVFTLLLLAVNLVSHFIPFERNSVAPDDYSILLLTSSKKATGIVDYLLTYPDRPLGYFFLDLQSKLVGDNAIMGLLFVFFSSIFVLIVVFLLLKELFNNIFLAFIGALIFCILPNKLEVYHTPIYANLNIIMGIYIVSLLFFLYFIRSRKYTYLFISLATYTVAIFSYEVGFFMPVVMALYSFLYSKNSKKYVFYFAIPFVVFIIYRLTGAFGLVSMGRKVNLSVLPFNIIELFHQFFGRYMVRNILYGVYKFLSIESPWLIIIILSNIGILIIVAFWLRKKELRKINSHLLLLAGTIFISFLMPILLNNTGGVGGRHLVLPSIGITIFTIWLLEKTKQQWRLIFLLFMIATLIICQGNAWTQVVACRINGAVYETMKERKKELLKAENIIIDTKSFADNIPSTWVKRDFNVLNTYYGAQTFESWGLTSMVRLVTSNANKSVYVATESPKVMENGVLEFAISEQEGYRSVSKKTMVLPQRGTVIIDFKSVYGDVFDNGTRKR